MDARQELIHLINQYAFTIDTGDLEGFAALFECGELIVEGFAPMVGKPGVLQLISGVRLYDDGTPKTRHVITNVDIRLGEDNLTAKCQSYLSVFQQTSEFPLQVIFSGHYFDDFEFVERRWRFVKRLIRYPLIGDMSAHLNEPAAVVPNIHR